MGRYTVRVPFYDDTYLNKKLTAQQTSFEVLRGKISAIISDSEIEEYRNGNITMASRLSSAIQTVDGFSQHVSSLESSYNAATGEFSSLKTKVSTFDQTVDGFTQQVASWERVEGKNSQDIKDIQDGLENYVLESNLVSKINQSADKIDLSVVNTSTLYSKTDVDNMLSNYTPTADLNRHIEQNKSELNLSDAAIISTVTGSSYWGDQAQAIIDLGDAKDEIAEYVDQLKRTTAAKSTVYYGSNPPDGTTDNPLKTGDLWIDTFNKNCIKRYNTSNKTWTAVDNKEIAEALKAAGDAQATADGKIQTFSGTAAQRDNTTKDLDVGDLWFTTDEDNKPFRWNGSRWIDIRDGAIETLVGDVKDAYDLADSKIVTFYGSNEPQNPDTGDIWLQSINRTNTKTGKQYKETVIKRYDGSEWITIQDTGLETALNAAGDAQATADGKIETYFQAEPPTSTSSNPLDHGDLWFDSDDNNKCYRYNKDKSTPGWEEVKDKRIEAAYKLAEKKVTTYYGTSIPADATPVAGDLWIDTTKDANNKVAKVLKRYSGSNWIVVDSPYLMEAYNTACDAADLADCKMQVFYEPGPNGPRKTSANQLDVGDLWIDSSNEGKNKLYRWNGSQWVSVQDGFIELANQLASDAKSLAEKKVTTYTSRTAPTKTTHPDLSDGDLWFNTTTAKDPVTGAFVAKNDVKRWDESQTPPQWVDCSDIRFAEAAAGIADLDDEKAQIFLQTTKPANNAANNLDKGDLWINTNDKNRIHIWDPAANSGQGDWVVADKALDELVKWKSEAQIALTKDSIYQTITTWDGGGMELVNMINQTPEGTKIFGRHIQIEAGDSITSAITDGSIKPYYQSTEPKSPKIGDIWYNTSSSNYKIYTYCTVNGTAQWVETEQDKVPKDQVINSINQTPEGTKIDAKRIEITSGSEIQLSIDKATTIGENKSRTFRTSEKPLQGTDSVTGKPKISTGDMWIDTTKGQDNKIYYWNGSYWQEDSIVSRINLSNENVTIDGGKIDISANESYSITAGNANKALAQATTRSKIFRTDKAPLQSTDSNGFPNIRQGDMWVDTASGHNNQIYIWNGLSWQQDTVVSRINASTEGTKINADKIDIVASSNLRLMVTGKSKVFAQDAKPEREKDSATDTYNFNKGDIWYDTDDNYKMYVCTYVNGTTSTWTVASQDLVQKDKIISSINADTSGVQIKGSKIKLEATDEISIAVKDAKGYADTQATAATAAANTATDNKLKDYTKTAELKIGINGIQTKVVGANIDLKGTKNAAVTAANTATDNKLKDYTKTTSLMSYINQQTDKIELGVIKNSSALTAKLNDASGNAKVFRSQSEPQQSVTDGIPNVAVGDIWYDTTPGKNKMYFCSAANNTECTWTPDAIISRINMDNSGVQISGDKIKITANNLSADVINSIRLNANTISWNTTYSTMSSSGVLTSKSSDGAHKITIDAANGSPALNFVRNSINLGYIGTNNTSNSSYRGIVFDLKYTGNYMAWACDSDNDGDFDWKWVYTRNATGDYAANRLHALVPIDMHKQSLLNVGPIDATGYRIRGYHYSNDGEQGVNWTAPTFYIPTAMNPDGTAAKWQKVTMKFKSGILIG